MSDKQLPEEYKMRFARIAAEFRTKHPMVTHDDMVELMQDVVTVYSDIMSADFELLRKKWK